MRYWLFGVVLLMCVAAATGQTINKKKDNDKKDADASDWQVKEIAGKTFKDWVKEIHADDPSDREVAIKTILNFGPKRAYEALPDILKELEKHKETAPVDLSVRVNGTIAVGTIFMGAKVPEDKALKEKHEKYLTEAAAIFKANLFAKDKKDQAILRIRTLQALPALGPAAKTALPDVIALIKDYSTWETRKEAIVALMFLTSFDPKGAPLAKAQKQLYDAFDPEMEHSAIVRCFAVQGLVTMAQAHFAAAQLAQENERQSALNNAEIEKQTIAKRIENMLRRERAPEKKIIVRIEAHKAVIMLKHVAGKDIDSKTRADHLDKIANYLNYVTYRDSTIRLNALKALGSLGPPAATAIVLPKVLDTLRGDPDINLVGMAMMTLIGMEAYDATRYLETMKSDESLDKTIRNAAEDTINQLNYIRDTRKKEKEKKKNDNKK